MHLAKQRDQIRRMAYKVMDHKKSIPYNKLVQVLLD